MPTVSNLRLSINRQPKCIAAALFYLSVGGMDITTAQLLSGCEVIERDEAKEESALNALSEEFYHFSPYIDRYRSDELTQSGLSVEISSCLKLFGGIKALSEMMFAHLAQTPYGFEHGLGHSAKAAWYLSFDYQEVTGHETKSLFIERLNRQSIDLLLIIPKKLKHYTRQVLNLWRFSQTN